MPCYNFDSLMGGSHAKVTITLADKHQAGQTGGFVPTYTTGDKIEGVVIVEVQRDCRVDDVRVFFEGDYTYLPVYLLMDG